MPRAVQEAKSEASVANALESALGLFSSQGFRATSMREIAAASGLSVGNLYHHFANKEEIFQRLLDQYWERVLDPDLRLNQIIARAEFPEDLEKMASAVEEVVDAFAPYILLIYVDVIEFEGRHVRTFYEGMAGRFEAAYGERLRQRQANGDFGDVNPMVGVMVAVRWFFYFHTIEKCFGAPAHFGMSPQ
ncbi:MAG: TetR/AcrR family transcriptional regulator, partial [Gammaproteobacteria bacterium]|nr:TetR/AcrR family transcriptional regulator [Gammaproteobacteria bacterium]